MERQLLSGMKRKITLFLSKAVDYNSPAASRQQSGNNSRLLTADNKCRFTENISSAKLSVN